MSGPAISSGYLLKSLYNLCSLWRLKPLEQAILQVSAGRRQRCEDVPKVVYFISASYTQDQTAKSIFVGKCRGKTGNKASSVQICECVRPDDERVLTLQMFSRIRNISVSGFIFLSDYPTRTSATFSCRTSWVTPEGNTKHLLKLAWSLCARSSWCPMKCFMPAESVGRRGMYDEFCPYTQCTRQRRKWKIPSSLKSLIAIIIHRGSQLD